MHCALLYIRFSLQRNFIFLPSTFWQTFPPENFRIHIRMFCLIYKAMNNSFTSSTLPWFTDIFIELTLCYCHFHNWFVLLIHRTGFLLVNWWVVNVVLFLQILWNELLVCYSKCNWACSLQAVLYLMLTLKLRYPLMTNYPQFSIICRENCRTLQLHLWLYVCGLISACIRKWINPRLDFVEASCGHVVVGYHGEGHGKCRRGSWGCRRRVRDVLRSDAESVHDVLGVMVALDVDGVADVIGVTGIMDVMCFSSCRYDIGVGHDYTSVSISHIIKKLWYKCNLRSEFEWV